MAHDTYRFLVVHEDDGTTSTQPFGTLQTAELYAERLILGDGYKRARVYELKADFVAETRTVVVNKLGD